MAHNFFYKTDPNLAAMKGIDYRALNFFKLILKNQFPCLFTFAGFLRHLDQARLELKGSLNKSKARAYMRSIVKSCTEFQAWPNKLRMG